MALGSYRRAQAARDRRPARDTPVPLPGAGLHYDAQRGRVNPSFAAALTDMVTDGATLRIAPGSTASAPIAAWQSFIRTDSAWTDDESQVLGILDVFNSADTRETYPGLLGGEERPFVVLHRSFTSLSDTAYDIPDAGRVVDTGLYPIDYSVGVLSGFYLVTALFPNEITKFDVASGAKSTAAFTLGGAAYTAINLAVHRSRAYMWSNRSLKLYYGPVGGVGGAVTLFDLGAVGNVSGSIIAVSSMTMSNGTTSDDVMVICTDQGEVLIYSGGDPGVDWALWARVRIPPPLSKMCMVRSGGDVLVLTASGVISIAMALQGMPRALASPLAAPILGLMPQFMETEILARAQLFVSGDQRFLVVNLIADSETEARTQFVYDMKVGAWFQTQHADAGRWINFNSREMGYVSVADGRAYISHLSTLSNPQPTFAGDGGSFETAWFSIKGGTLAYVEPTFWTTEDEVTLTLTVLADGDDSAAARAERVQTVTLSPSDNTVTGVRQSVRERIPVGQQGSRFRIVMAIAGADVELTEIIAGVA